MSNAENRSATLTTTSKTPRWRRALAGIVSGALAIGGLSLSPLFTEAAEAAATTGTLFDTGGWHSGKPLNVFLATTPGGNTRAPFTPINKNTLYGSSYNDGGTVFTFARDGATPRANGQAIIGYGRGVLSLQSNPLSTIAIDADPYGTRGAKFAYMWGWDTTNYIDSTEAAALGMSNWNGWAGSVNNYVPIFRIGENQSDFDILMIPDPDFFPDSKSIFQYWSGGEVIQRTGEIFFGGGECTILDDGYRMMIVDPVTMKYNYSGRILPNTPQDDIFVGTGVSCGGQGYVASDFALDANGNAYLSVVSNRASSAFGLAAASRVWLVKVVPSETGDWKYNLVTPLSRAPGQAARVGNYLNGGTYNYGSAFYNGMQYVTMWQDGGNLLEVNPMSAQVYNLPHGTSPAAIGPVQNYVQDLASGQTAMVLEGDLYNDLNGNGDVADDGYVPAVNQTVALYFKDPYTGTWTYQGQRQTDGAGNYSFLVGGAGDYILRVVRPSLGGVNGVQTWGSSYIGHLPGLNNEAKIICTNGDISNVSTPGGPGAICDGALAAPVADPALPTADNAPGRDTSTQPAAMPIYATVHMETDQEVVKVDFGLSYAGSGGDASTGPSISPTTNTTAPIHNNNANPPVWLGATLGRYAPPSFAINDTGHNATDDGVYIDSYAGKISLTGTILAATKNYTISADLSGPQASSAFLHGWLQQNATGTNLGGTAWNPTAKWNPTITGNKATGSLQLTTGAIGATPVQADFRAQVSPVDITVPTNAANSYQAAPNGTTAWTTPGEVEDYQISGADTVYRPAAKTKSGSATFNVDVQSLSADNTKITIGDANAAAAGTQKSITATVPDASWTVASVTIKDVEDGSVLYTPTVATMGNNTTITWTPTLGDDVIVEVLFQKNPSETKSVLTLDKASATVKTDITATASVKDGDDNPLENVTVTFANASADTQISASTCTTDSAGECSITITSEVADTYVDELSAKVLISGTPTDIAGSPATVTFTSGAGVPGSSELAVSPAGPLSVDDGVNIYTATTTVYDGVGSAHGGKGNLVSGETVTYSVTREDGTAVDSTKTKLSATTCSTSAVGTCNVTLTSDEAGSFKIYATISATDVNYSPVTVEYIPGEICIPGVPAGKVCHPDPDLQTKIYVDPDNALADGVSADVVHVQSFDTKGNARTGDEFILSTTDPALTIAQATLLTGADGKNVTDTFSTVAGGHILTATLAGIALSVEAGSPLTVTFKAGDPDKDQSTLVLDKNETTVGAPIVATVTVKDATGNLVKDGRDVILTLSGEATFGTDPLVSPKVTSLTCNTGTTGTCSVAFTNWKAETIAVTAVTDIGGVSTALEGSPASAKFNPGTETDTCLTAALQCSTLSASPLSLGVGENSTVTALVTDEYGNPTPGVTVNFGVTGSGSLNDASLVTGTDGLAITTVTDDVAETVQVTGTFGALATEFAQSPVSVTFTAGAPDPNQSVLSLDKSSTTAGDPIVATVVVKDALGNLLDGAAVSFSITGDGTFGAANATKVGTATCTTTASGTCSVTLTDPTAELVDVHATVLVAGTPVDVSGSPASATFVPGSGVAINSTFDVTPSLTPLVTTSVTGTVTVKDILGNLVGGDVVTFYTEKSGDLSANTCTTNNDKNDPAYGTCWVTLTDAVAETVAFGAKVGGDDALGSPKQIQFRTSGPSLPKSTFDVTPAGSLLAPLVADGIQAYVGTLTLVDDYDNLISDYDTANITFGASSGSVDITSVVNAGSGKYTVNYTTTVASPNYTASVHLTVPVGQVGTNLPIPFTAGTAVSTKSELVVAPTTVVADGASAATATVTLKDTNDNLVGGVNVTFDASGGVSALLSAGNCTTNNTFADPAFGTCSVTVTDTTAETVTVTAKLGTETIPVPTDVTFTVGTVSAAKSDITVAPASQVVGVDVTVTVKARDINDNAVSGLTVDQFTISTTNDKSAPQLTVSDFTPLSNGIYTFKTTSEKVATFTFSAVVDGVTLTQHPTATFTNGGTAAATSFFVMTVNDQLANGIAQDKAVAHANDIYGNAVPGAEVNVLDETMGLNAGYLNPVEVECITGADGTCELAWTSTRVGTYTGQGTIDLLSPSNGSGILNQIRFSAGDLSAANSELVVTPTTLNVGQTSTATVTVRDITGVLVPGAVVSFSLQDTLSDRPDGTKAPWLSEAYCMTGADGTCFVTLTSQISGVTQVHATVPIGGIATDLGGNGSSVKASPQTVTFQPEVVCYPSATVTCSPTSTLKTRVEVTTNGAEANGTAQDIATAYAFDKWGNPVSGVDVQTSTADADLNLLTPSTTTGANGSAELKYTSIVAGGHVANVLIGGVTPQGSPVTLTFGSGVVANAVLTKSPVGPIEVDQVYTLTLTATDGTSNPVSGAVVAFSVPSDLSVTGAGVPSCTTNSSGQCSLTVTTTKAGSYNVFATVPGVTVTGSPATLVFTAGPICIEADGCVRDPGAPRTEVTLIVDGSLANGIAADVASVKAFDKHGNPVQGAVVDSTTLDADLTIVKPIAPTGTDGSSTIQYTSNDAGVYEAAVTVGGKTPAGSPVKPAFAAGAGVAANSSWTITPAGPLTVGTGADATYTATTTVRDSSNNVVLGAIVTITAAPAGVTFPSGVTCTTNASGVCSVPFYSTKSGTFEFSSKLGSDQIQTALSRAWEPDEVCAEASGCVVVDPTTPLEKRTRVEVTTDGVIADGSQRDVVTVYAFDQWGNPVPGALVKSKKVDLGDDLNIQTGIAGTNAVGESTIWYTSFTAGPHDVEVSVDEKIPANGKDNSGEVTLNFVPGPGSAANSDFAVDLNTAVVGTPVTGTATVRDVYDNLVSGAVVTFGITGSATLSAPTCTTGADGTCTVTINDTVKESVDVSATILVSSVPTAITGSPQTIVFTSAGIDPMKSTFHVTPTGVTLVANGTDTYTAVLTARDSADNPVTGLDLDDIVFAATHGDTDVTSVTEEANGVYTVKLTSKVAHADTDNHTVSVTHQTEKIGLDHPVPFGAGPVSAVNSDITVAPASQVVGADVTVTIKVRDDFNNSVTGLAVGDFAITTTNDKSAPQLTVRDFTPLADGYYTFKTTSEKVATFTFSAVVGGVTLTQQPTATFTNGGTAAATSYFEMTVNDQLANGTAKDEAKAYARDTYGNPVPGATVSVEDETTGANAGFLTPQTAVCTTGADGTCVLQWSATHVGTYTGLGTIDLLAPSDGSGVLNQIRFSAGNLSAVNSTLVVTPTTLTVGQTSTATVTIRDTSGILVPNAVASFSLQDALSDRPDGTKAPWLSEAYCVTGADGTCSVTLTSQIAGVTQVHATVPVGGIATDITGSPQTVTFQADVICIPSATVTCSPTPELQTRVEVTKNGAEANGIDEDTATAWAFDKWGNPVSAIDVQTTTTYSNLNRLTPTLTTDTAGSALLRYTSTVAGSHEATVLINGVNPQGSPLTLTFGSGTVANAVLTVSPVGPIEVDEVYTLTLKATDGTGNNVLGAVVAFAVPSNLTITGAGVPSCTTDSTGQCSITVTTIKAGSYNVPVAVPGVSVTGSPATLVFTAGPICIEADGCVPDPGARKTDVVLTVTGQLADGVSPDIAVVHAYDKHDNPISGLSVTSTAVDPTKLTVLAPITPTGADGSTTIKYTSNAAGEHVANVTVDGKTPAGSPVKPAFAAGKGVAANSTWTITPAGPLIVGTGAAATYTATTTVRDASDNVVLGAIVTINSAQPGVTFPSGATCTTNASGVCSVSFYSTKSGTYEFTSLLATEQIQTALSRAWEPDEVCAELSGCVVVDPTTPLEKRTRVEVTTNNVVADGSQRDVVTAYAFDQWGNPVPGALVKSSTADSSLTIQTGIAGTNAAGVSTIWYSSFVAGNHEALVTVDDKVPLNGKDNTGSVTLNFVPGTPSATNSSLAADPTTLAAGTDSTATATIRDINNNPVPGVVVTFGVLGGVDAKPELSDPTCTTGASGTCSVTVTDTVIGEVKVSASIQVAGLATPITNSPVTLLFTNACIPHLDPVGCPPPDWVDDNHRTRVEVTIDFQREGGDRDVATVYYFDQFGNPVAGGQVDSEPMPIAATLLNVLTLRAPTSPLGLAHVEYSAHIAGAHPAIVTIDDIPVVFVPQPGGPLDGDLVAIAAKSSPATLNFVDVSAPLEPIILHPSDGDLTNDRPLTVDGTAEPGSTVTVVDKTTGGTVLCTATANAAGNWTCDVDLTDGDHTLVASAEDSSSNRSPDSDPVNVKVDTTPPDKPVVDTANGTQVGGDAGSAEPGSTIEVTWPDGSTGITNVDPDGSWTIPTPPGTDSGDITVTATDPAGNTSDETKVWLDTEAPDAPRVDTANGTQVGGDAGSAEAGSTIEVIWPDGSKDTTTVNPDGSWTIPTPPGTGSGDIIVTATDPVGNKSDETKKNLDTDSPGKPVVDPTDGSQVTGKAEPGATVNITDVDGNTVTCQEGVIVAGTDGSFKCTPLTPLVENDVIYVTATDEAGNPSAPALVIVGKLRIWVEFPVRAPEQNQIVVGSGFVPGETVTLEFFSDPQKVGTGIVDAAGVVVVSFQVPKGTSGGVHTVRYTGDKSGSSMGYVETTFVVEVKVDTGGYVLTSGGNDSGSAAALLLVGLGVAVIGVVSRRKKVEA